MDWAGGRTGTVPGDHATQRRHQPVRDLFELATWEELQALLDENGPDELLQQIRAAEARRRRGPTVAQDQAQRRRYAVYLVLS